MPTMPDELTSRTWARLVRARDLLLERIEADLKAADLPPLRWYDVLLELDRTGPRGLRQFEICDSVLLSKYNVSRLLDRLENEGLLTRYLCEDDARGTRVLISGKGRDLRKRMWKVYGPALRAHFAEHFSRSELEQLSDLLGRLPGVPRRTL